MPPLPEILSRRSPSAHFDVLIMYEDFGTGAQKKVSDQVAGELRE